jgi:hypothetical protein
VEGGGEAEVVNGYEEEEEEEEEEEGIWTFQYIRKGERLEGAGVNESTRIFYESKINFPRRSGPNLKFFFDVGANDVAMMRAVFIIFLTVVCECTAAARRRANVLSFHPFLSHTDDFRSNCVSLQVRTSRCRKKHKRLLMRDQRRVLWIRFSALRHQFCTQRPGQQQHRVQMRVH